MSRAFDLLSLDVRQAALSLRRRPAFALAATSVLAVAVGMSVTVFVVAYAAFLRPLPFRDPDQLMWLNTREPVGNAPGPQALSPLQYSRWREETRAFAGVEAFTPRTIALGGSGEPEALRGAAVSAGLFSMLGASPLLGRHFSRDEELAGSGVAIISHSLWQRRFGADPGVIGRRIILDDEPRTVVAVMPAGFAPAMQPGDVWVPVSLSQQDLGRPLARMLAGVGRLRPGVTPAQATTALDAIGSELAREHPQAYRYTRASVRPLREELYGSQRGALLLVFAAAALLFLLACINVSSVALSNALARDPETAVRRALGASPGRLLRVALVESLAVASAGALAGLGLTVGALAALRAWFPTLLANYGSLSLDSRAALFAALLAAIAALVIGAPSALRAFRGRTEWLRVSSGRVTGSRGVRRARAWMLGGQVAMAFVLLTAAGLLLRGFERLMSTDIGYAPEGVLTFQFHPSRQRYQTPEARATYVRRVLEELASIPGVESVGSTQASFGAAENMQTSFEIDGRPAREGEFFLSRIRHVTPGYFRALRVAMRAGRTFGEADRIGAPAVAIVSESFARQYWPGENAVGKRLRRAGSVVLWMEVVGVAADVRDVGVADPPAPTLYVPYLQQNTPTARVTVLLRTRVPPMRLADAAERAVWKVDPGQVIDFEMPLETLLGRTVVVQRLQTVLLGVFAVGGLGVVLVGLYGLVSFSVVRRSREIALRSALGAGRGAVLGLVVDDVLRPVLIGLVIGLASSVGLALYVRGAVPELTLADPAVFVTIPVGLLAFAALAAAVPSSRALRIDPATALRED